MPIFRSFLFAPGNHPRRVEKCLTLGADAVILDLEDAVANAEKAGTRAVVVEALRRPRRCRGYVRVNALGTPWSHGDFTLDLGITWSADESELLPYRSAFIAHSRAAGLEPPIDTVWVSLGDPEGFARSVQRSKDLGFQGKLCIHPDQVPVVNARFSPTETELAHARRVVTAFAQAERDGLAAIQVDGQFVDYPIVYRAERLIARADAIAEAGRRD
jgi:citrate lyase beta subunit